MWTRRRDRLAKARTVLAPQLGPWPLGEHPRDKMPSAVAVVRPTETANKPLHKCERCGSNVATQRFALTSEYYDFQAEEKVETTEEKYLCGRCGFVVVEERKPVLLQDDAGREEWIYPLRYVRVAHVV